MLVQELLCCGRDFSLHGLYIEMEPMIASVATTKAWRERAHWFGVHTSCDNIAGQQPEGSLEGEEESSSEDESEDDCGASGVGGGRLGMQRAAKKQRAKARALHHAPEGFKSPFQVKSEALASQWLIRAQGEVRNRSSEAAG